MLRVENLAKGYTNQLFEKISFTLGNREKVGLVGLNGCGKTTLFRLIMGTEEPDEGTVSVVDSTIGYLPQELDLDPNLLVGEYLEMLLEFPTLEMYKVNQILGKLNLADIDHYKYIYQISEGQKMKLYLCKMLLEGSESLHTGNPILLLDEPTNHLDLDGIVWFEDFIKNYQGICIMISHDRSFLNASVDRIFEMDEGGLNIFEGGYDDYLIGKEEWLRLREKEFVHQEKHREKLEELIKNAGKLRDGKRRGKALRAARKRMTREVTINEISQYKDIHMKDMGITGTIHKQKKMLELKNVKFSYDGEIDILKGIDITMWGQDKVWLYGGNGSGKTTLIKQLTSELTPTAGEVVWGPNTTFAYFSQDQSHMKMDMKVADFFMDATGISYEKSFGALDKFLFDKSFRLYTIRDLSPGQRARLSFAIFAQQDYDFLILDEPTNHLDIKTKELIESALNEFQGNVLLISHDRYFVDEVEPNRVVTIKDGVLTEED